jgi:hypothetical protein
MQSRNATIVSKRSKLSGFLRIVKDDDGSQTWSKTGGSLDLGASSGTWWYNPNGSYLVFYSAGGDPVMMLLQVPSNFLDGFCSTTYTGEGDLLLAGSDVTSKEQITWTIGEGCI